LKAKLDVAMKKEKETEALTDEANARADGFAKQLKVARDPVS
jgi:AmiR/NasT family two-component response regulator